MTATTRTDESGRFVLNGAWKLREQEFRYLGLFARAGDGRCGWVSTIWRNNPASEDTTIELGEVGEASGRLIDQDGKPISDVEVKVASLDRTAGKPGVYDEIALPPVLETLFTREGRG